MTENRVKNICKWISVCFVAVSVLLMFMGVIKISRNSDVKKVSEVFDSYIAYVEKSREQSGKEVDDFDMESFSSVTKEDLEEMQEDFDKYGIKLKPKVFVKDIEKTYSALQNGKFTYWEIISFAHVVD